MVGGIDAVYYREPGWRHPETPQPAAEMGSQKRRNNELEEEPRF